MCFQFRKFESGLLEFFVFVWNRLSKETEAGGGLAACAGCRLVPEIALDERTEFFVPNQHGVLADTGEPALEHDLDEAVVFFVGGCRGLGEGEGGDDGLGVAGDDGFVELLEFDVGAGDVAVG